MLHQPHMPERHHRRVVLVEDQVDLVIVVFVHAPRLVRRGRRTRYEAVQVGRMAREPLSVTKRTLYE